MKVILKATLYISVTNFDKCLVKSSQMRNMKQFHVKNDVTEYFLDMFFIYLNIKLAVHFRKY